MTQEEILQNGMMPMEEENSNFDLMEWVIRILHHWYLFAIAAVIAFSLAYLKNKRVIERYLTTGTMIISNWNNIRYNNVRSSVGFQNVLKQIGLDTHELTENTYRQNKLINKLYNLSKNEDDRNACRNTILEHIKQRLMKDFEEYSKEFENFGMSLTIEIK